MGSGCTSGSIGPIKPISDTSVVYTGDPYPTLGICRGDTLDEVEAAVLNALTGFTNGSSIKLPTVNLTQCALFTQYITCCNTSCTDLPCLINIIFSALCILYTDFTTLNTSIGQLLSGPYNTGCLTLPNNPTLNAIIQELITEFCVLVSQVNALQTQVNSLSTGLPGSVGTFLGTAIQSCQTDAVTKSGTGASTVVTFAGFAPIGTILMYGGSLTGKFDTTGRGISPGPMCGWALCNSNNGTVDMRGYFPVGVNDGSMGSAAQNNEVSNSVNPGQAYNLASHGGTINVTLSAAQIPSVSITGTSTTSCTTNPPLWKASFRPGNNTGVSYNYAQQPPVVQSITCTGTLTGSTTGGGGSHENRPPYRALYFIQRIA